MKDIEILRERAQQNNNVFQPVIYRLEDDKDRASFERLLEDDSIYVHDELYDQLKELIKSRSPAAPIPADHYPALIEKHLNGTPITMYGVWVYYPWSKRLVHILDKTEFIEVRTSRNQYKINNTERDLLANKKVGVIGLSVGQSVSLTMAMERGCGELRLADFDVLELTNYNRIRTGLHNLGIKKVIAVAREIMEIDPYLVVKCYDEGITEENIGSFIDDGTGKLDLLIDECDSVDIKILCRIKAREQQIPVVMEASDRGTIDVERFDLQPDRPILHGRVAHLDLEKLKHLKTNEEKVPYILPIAGTDTLSTRMKASMLEVGRTITTWPQLASAVALGGGITADVCRRIFLDEYHESGRYFIDIEELICDKKNPADVVSTSASNSVSVEEMDALIISASLQRQENNIIPEEAFISEIVSSGILAPSIGNQQPWKWRYNNGILYQFIDHSDYVSVPQKKSHISDLGAATENIVLQALQNNVAVEVISFPLGIGSKLVSGYRFCEKNVKTALEHQLAEAIPHRHTNRRITDRKPVDDDVLNGLSSIAGSVEGANLTFVTGDNELNEIADLIGKAEKIWLLDESGHKSFVNEIIWPSDEGTNTNRGVSLDAFQLRPSELVAYNMIKNEDVRQYHEKWGTGSGLEWFGKKYVLGASAIGLVTMPAGDEECYFSGGRAMERMWLAATAQGLAVQPLPALPMLFSELKNADANRFSEKVENELWNMRKSYEKLFSLSDKREEIMLFRIFIDNEKADRGVREPVNKVLSFS